MKVLMKILAVTLIAAFVAVACSKNDNPIDNNLFIGTYTGTTSYKVGNSIHVPVGSGKVVVTKLGNNYRFDFTDNGTIPSITGITISKNDSLYVGTAPGYTGTISISQSMLKIALMKDSATWMANCTR